MRRRHGWTRRVPLEILVTAALGACGGGSEEARAAGNQPDDKQATAAASAAGTAECSVIPTQEVTRIMGTPAKLVQRFGSRSDGWTLCHFMLSEPGEPLVGLSSHPAAKTDSIYGEVREGAKGIVGQDAELERISIGEGGWAYGSTSLAEAAAVARGRVYHAEMQYTEGGDTDLGDRGLGDRKDALVQLVRAMIR